MWGWGESENVDPSHGFDTDLGMSTLPERRGREKGFQKTTFSKENMKHCWKFYRDGWGMQKKKNPSVGLVCLETFWNKVQ